MLLRLHMVTVRLRAQSGHMVTFFSKEHTKLPVNRYGASKLFKDYFKDYNKSL